MKRIVHSGIRAITALFALTLGAPPQAQAAPAAGPFTVDSFLDQIDVDPNDGACATAPPAHCTLRAAVMQANATSGAGVTIIVPSGTYTLTRPIVGGNDVTGGDLNLTTPSSGNPVITIQGAGAATTFLDANQLDRLIVVHSNRTAVITGVTIRHGYVPDDEGGGILNYGNLTLYQTRLTDNVARVGGGLGNFEVLTVTDSLLDINRTDFGGGLYNRGDAYLSRSTLSGNHANYDGAGLSNEGAITVTAATISHNTADKDGGGIYNSVLIYLINSTVSLNNAKINGGGIANGESGEANLGNVSIVFNGADADLNASGTGGGVTNGPTAVLGMRNSIIAGNWVTEASFYNECAGAMGAYGHNLIGTTAADVPCTITGAAGTWGYLNTVASLGLLQNNGGPSLTHALRRDSNAIDFGDPTLGCIDGHAVLLPTDQRGAARIVGVRCDVGAFEYRPPLYLPFVRR